MRGFGKPLTPGSKILIRSKSNEKYDPEIVDAYQDKNEKILDKVSQVLDAVDFDFPRKRWELEGGSKDQLSIEKLCINELKTALKAKPYLNRAEVIRTLAEGIANLRPLFEVFTEPQACYDAFKARMETAIEEIEQELEPNFEHKENLDGIHESVESPYANNDRLTFFCCA